jgi:hypothetical protein
MQRGLADATLKAAVAGEFLRTASVGLVIPAWQEAECIGAVLSEVPAAGNLRVFVVCGGPGDATAAVAAAHGAEPLLQVTPGYGAACWLGAP